MTAMSSLSSRDRRCLEPFLDMGGGFVPNFSDRTMGEFFQEQVGLNIDDDKYQFKGTSKAKRMRAFWELESDHIVAQALDALIEWGEEFRCLPDDPQQRAAVEAIIPRLKLSSPVPEMDAPLRHASTPWTLPQRRSTFGPRSGRTSMLQLWTACTSS